MREKQKSRGAKDKGTQKGRRAGGASGSRASGKVPALRLGIRRGAIVSISAKLAFPSALALVISNDVQNEASDFVLVLPLERKRLRIRAAFAVELGKESGLEELYWARCDRISCLRRSDVRAIEIAQVSSKTLEELAKSLSLVLGL